MGPAIEASVGVSASRQKNCNNCVQAKRRCDRRTPICARCAEKNMACVYGKTKAVNRLGKHARQPTDFTESLSFDNLDYSPLDMPGLSFDLNPFETIPTGFHPSFATEATPQSTQDTPSGSDISVDAFMHFAGHNSSSSSDHWLVRPEEGYPSERPTTTAEEELVGGWGEMASCASDNLQAWHAYDPKMPLHYILNRVKGFTEEMATKNSTPFLHQQLYRHYTPQCIVLCFTTCVLYANRTPANTSMTIKALSNSASELIDTELCRVVSTPIEKLARTQALFLYQIIRLFDGDITLRAHGEKDMGLLQTWLRELSHLRDNLGDLAQLEDASVREKPPVEWEKWVFAECVRRTIILAYSVLGLYELMKDPKNIDPNGPWAYVHRWTLGRALWEASSSAEFQRAWKESPHFVIANFTFKEFIENGQAQDVDEFAEILLSLYMGVDEMKEFMAPRKIK
ncbi:hypothetical protein F4825DRAFT_76212 [Nemania diffusa]|nr:hypothetical protein F4825DRAFT_76212 [Nemania diffusa]